MFSSPSAAPELVAAPAPSQQDQVANEAQATASVSLDTSQPITNIQIRLADGGRLIQKFNHTHRYQRDLIKNNFGCFGWRQSSKMIATQC